MLYRFDLRYCSRRQAKGFLLDSHSALVLIFAMAISKLCRFAEVAWVTVLGTYYGAFVFFLFCTLIGRLLPIHFEIDDFKPFLPFFRLVLGLALFAILIGMLSLGQEYHRHNPRAITLARILLFIGIIYSLLAVALNVWLFYIHAHASSLLYLIKSVSMLVGNALLVICFIKTPPAKGIEFENEKKGSLN